MVVKATSHRLLNLNNSRRTYILHNQPLLICSLSVFAQSSLIFANANLTGKEMRPSHTPTNVKFSLLCLLATELVKLPICSNLLIGSMKAPSSL